MPHLVFVYGTLKRGFPNHATMDGATFVALAQTVERYPMIVQGQHYSPVMMPEPGQGHRIVGELWEVDDAKLEILDRLESTHLPTGYLREQIAVEPAAGQWSGGGTVKAGCYFKPRARVTLVHSEPHADYQDRRYVPSSKRVL
jgi:gamma-glutamylaminecyclotransferase